MSEPDAGTGEPDAGTGEPDAGTGEPDAGTIEIDGPRRLSRSRIWELQRRFYAAAGVSAWEAQVPHYVTNHPYIAEAYARVVLGYLRDARREHGDEPVHIVELGAGVGRFAFHFLRALLSLVERSALRGTRVRYVLTDFTDAPFAWWREHPALRPYFAAGQLDLARFDCTADTALCLEQANRTLGPGELGGPLIAIANYVFDSIPHDAFQIIGGALHDRLVAVHGPREIAAGDPALFGAMQLAFRTAPVARPYGDELLDDLLRDYAAQLGDSALAFPVEAIRCVRRLHELAGGRLLVLSGDRGYHRIEDILASGDPLPNIHGGAVSFPINHHAIGRAVERLGGVALAPDHPYVALDLCAFVTGLGDPRETALAFREALDATSPDDFFAVRQALELHHRTATLEQLIALVRLSSYDATVFERVLPMLELRVRYSEIDEIRSELARIAREVWRRYFAVPGDADLAFAIGRFFVAIECWSDAIEPFEHSVRDRGETAETARHLELCRSHG